MADEGQIISWFTWLRLILVSGGVGAAATFSVCKLFGDFWLRETLAELKRESDKELEKLKTELSKDLEQCHAKLDLTVTARMQVSQCLSEVNIAFSKLHPTVAGLSLDDE